MELPRRIILGWSPPGICVACGEGRRPVVVRDVPANGKRYAINSHDDPRKDGHARMFFDTSQDTRRTITGYACACTPYTDHPGTGEGSGQRYGDALADGDGYPIFGQGNRHNDLRNRPKTGPWREYDQDWTPPPTRPALVVDPFGGTGTTALVASMYGRVGVSFDLSADYCRLARWRTRDPAERAKAMQVPKPPPVPSGQGDLFEEAL